MFPEFALRSLPVGMLPSGPAAVLQDSGQQVSAAFREAPAGGATQTVALPAGPAPFLCSGGSGFPVTTRSFVLFPSLLICLEVI